MGSVCSDKLGANLLSQRIPLERGGERQISLCAHTHTTQLWKIDSRAFWLCVRVYQKGQTGIFQNSKKHPPALRLTEKRRFGKINIEQDTIPFYVCMPLLLLSWQKCLCVCVCWGCYYGNTSAISPLLQYISPGVCSCAFFPFEVHPSNQPAEKYAYIVAVTQNKMPVANWRSKHPILPLNCGKLKTAVHAWALLNDACLANRAKNARPTREILRHAKL